MSVADRKLEARELGRTGLKLSCIGFGASPLGNVFGVVSEEEAFAAVRLAFSLGINFFDTSPYYGGTLSETVLGKALRALGAPRGEFVVSTKCGRYAEGFDFSAERVTRSIDESLARLGLDYVDILQCHDIEFGDLDQIVNETIPALLKLKEAGKTRFIGITGLPLEIFTYVLDRVPPGSVDVILSYCHYSINDSMLEDLLPYLKSKGVGVISASPLSMGLLTENGPPEWHPASPELKKCLGSEDYEIQLMVSPPLYPNMIPSSHVPDLDMHIHLTTGESVHPWLPLVALNIANLFFDTGSPKS